VTTHLLTLTVEAFCGLSPKEKRLKHLTRVCAFVLVVTILVGCVTPAPGATHVRITSHPSDVSGCTAVGNISADAMNNLDPVVAQNQAVGLGGNAVLNTGAGGVAYRCDVKPSAGS
jgi:hypothetical protein